MQRDCLRQERCNMQIGETVLYNNHKYKIKHIYDDGSLKLVRSNEVIFRVPARLVQKQYEDCTKQYEINAFHV